MLKSQLNPSRNRDLRVAANRRRLPTITEFFRVILQQTIHRIGLSRPIIMNYTIHAVNMAHRHCERNIGL